MSTPLDGVSPEFAIDVIESQAQLDLVLARTRAHRPFEPFAEGVVQFFEDLSRVLLRSSISKQFPDAAAFGYWIRPGNITRLRERFERKREAEDGIRVPRGLSFHVAPGNVEALFAYSWATATLAGCSSVVKLSSRRSDLSARLAEAVTGTLSSYPELEGRWAFIQYPREREDLTQAMCLAADVLAFWGGDHTVNELRRHPVQPGARVITFPDRESIFALRTASYARLHDADRDALATRLASDIFMFGQAACSSPRYIVWVDDEDVGDTSGLARDLYHRIGRDDRWLTDITPTEVMAKRTYAYELAARGTLEEIYWLSPRWMVLKSGSDGLRESRHPALGTLVETRVKDLVSVSDVLRTNDQTVTYFGFDQDELLNWVSQGLGPWPMRLVPAGQAVDFDARWDGMDLLAEFTRIVTVD